jgi:hypothetical protein
MKTVEHCAVGYITIMTDITLRAVRFTCVATLGSSIELTEGDLVL